MGFCELVMRTGLYNKAEIVCKIAVCDYILIGLNQGLLFEKDKAMSQKNSDLQKIKELIEIMKQNGLVEVEIKHGDDKIFIKRSQPQPVLGGAAAPVVAPGKDNSPQALKSEVPVDAQPQDDLVDIKSPLVGTFYATPSPDSEPYVEIGSHVDAQVVVCIVEAMKVMNEIKTETSGTVVDILVTNGQAIEYGQVLFRIRPD